MLRRTLLAFLATLPGMVSAAPTRKIQVACMIWRPATPIELQGVEVFDNEDEALAFANQCHRQWIKDDGIVDPSFGSANFEFDDIWGEVFHVASAETQFEGGWQAAARWV